MNRKVLSRTTANVAKSEFGPSVVQELKKSNQEITRPEISGKASSFKHDFSRIPVSRISRSAGSISAPEGRKSETGENEEGALPGQVEIPKDQVGSVAVRTILTPGQRPSTSLRPPGSIQTFDNPKHATVAPGGVPAVNRSAAENTCLPSTASALLNWNVVSADAANWRADVSSLALAGQVNISPWPSDPANIVVPNTPNPVDGGNINNESGSPNHWQAVIDDLADYNSPGGGAGPNWHSTAASSAHEFAHWNTDYVQDSVASAAGGNWAQANQDIDALTVPKAANPDEAAARAALLPAVNSRVDTWRSATIARWNAIPDSPGVAGSTGYMAGMAVLNTHIAAIRAYAQSKGWIGGGASPTGASTGSDELSRGAKVGFGIAGGAVLGAGIGAFGGPIGALVGAGIGALAGGLLGGFL